VIIILEGMRKKRKAIDANVQAAWCSQSVILVQDLPQWALPSESIRITVVSIAERRGWCLMLGWANSNNSGPERG